MSDVVCPDLSALEIEPGSFLRKIDKRNDWNVYAEQPDSATNPQEIAEKVFREEQGVYSLWKIGTEEDFYGVVASLTAGATSKRKNIDFICISEAELAHAGIQPLNVNEGYCIKVESLHFNAEISKEKAQKLCSILLHNEKLASRCKKACTKAILQYQLELGCKAASTTTNQECKCEND